MSERIYNFSSGPAELPVEVLEKARDEMLSFNGSGMSVMELSHRSAEFETVLDAALTGIRDLLTIPDNYKVLFLQGGASLQFSMVPLNFLPQDASADYIITGTWSEKAAKAAETCGGVNRIFSSAATGFRRVPGQEELEFTADARYIHYASNETIDGVEFKYDVEGFGAPVICDASSNILSKPIDVEKYALIYAGAQKNMGPSGVTLVIVRDDLLASAVPVEHAMLNYKSFADHDSMPNTPNTWGIYIISLVCEWLREKGGVAAMKARNEGKAEILYAAIDSSDGFYSGRADRDSRSVMNVTFRLPSEELEKQFCTEALASGMSGLKGHRSVGGIRASIYNAFPLSGVETLAEFMSDFANKNG